MTSRSDLSGNKLGDFTLRRHKDWGWIEKTTATALLFASGIGVVFRSFSEAITSRLEVPGFLLVAAFFLYCGCLVMAVSRWVLAAALPTNPRWVRGLLTAFVAFLTLWPFIVPHGIDTRADRDEALDIGVGRLLDGQDPWTSTTQLGNHLSPLLGGLLLALPFAAIATASIQTPFWIGIGTYFGTRRLGTRPTGALVLLLVSSPVILNEILFESDVWVLAVIMSVAALAAPLAAASGRSWLLFASGLLCGLVIADRYLFLAAIVPIVVMIWRIGKWRSVLPWLIAFGGTAICLYLLMLMYLPASINSITTNASKAAAAELGPTGPLLGLVMFLVATVTGLAARSVANCLLSMCATMAVLPVWQSIVLTISGSPTTFNDYSVVSYSAVFLIFGLIGLLTNRTRYCRDTRRTS